jgi:hypothetical protein
MIGWLALRDVSSRRDQTWDCLSGLRALIMVFTSAEARGAAGLLDALLEEPITWSSAGSADTGLLSTDQAHNHSDAKKMRNGSWGDRCVEIGSLKVDRVDDRPS